MDMIGAWMQRWFGRSDDGGWDGIRWKVLVWVYGGDGGERQGIRSGGWKGARKGDGTRWRDR